jgi:hypothetical protein
MAERVAEVRGRSEALNLRAAGAGGVAAAAGASACSVADGIVATNAAAIKLVVTG